MNRGYWAGVMLFSLVVTGASGWYLWTALNEKKTIEVPLTKVEKTEPTPAAQAAPSTGPITKSVPMGGEKPEYPFTKDGKRKVTLTYKSSTAKKVGLISDFNKWFRKPMMRKGDEWTYTADLKPGTYEYKFVVDNKRTLDPENKETSKKGNSLLVVKPATPN